MNWMEFVAWYRKAQQTARPFITYGRDVMWHGEPCVICGSKKGISEVGGRYIVGDNSDDYGTPIVNVCGNCLKEVESRFEAMME